MRCGECKHWVQDEKSYRAVADLGECRKVELLWEATEWRLNEDGEPGYCDRVIRSELVAQMSFVQDGSDYSARLWTKPDFFCAHFEAPLTEK